MAKRQTKSGLRSEFKMTGVDHHLKSLIQSKIVQFSQVYRKSTAHFEFSEDQQVQLHPLHPI